MVSVTTDLLTCLLIRALAKAVGEGGTPDTSKTIPLDR